MSAKNFKLRKIPGGARDIDITRFGGLNHLSRFTQNMGQCTFNAIKQALRLRLTWFKGLYVALLCLDNVWTYHTMLSLSTNQRNRSSKLKIYQFNVCLMTSSKTNTIPSLTPYALYTNKNGMQCIYRLLLACTFIEMRSRSIYNCF